MDENRLPSLFEILNRFSKPPVDLWALYIYLKEQYGGVEYLEFWLDCAAHSALCKELGRELLKLRPASGNGNGGATGHNDEAHRTRHLRGTSMGGLLDDPAELDQQGVMNRAMTSNARTVSASDEIPPTHSPSSSVLFDILRDDALDTSSDKQRNSHNSQNSSNEERDTFDSKGLQGPKRFSTLSDERAKNKRDTVSRLSEILDNMQMPAYPSAIATSPTRTVKTSHGFGYEQVETEESYATKEGSNNGNNASGYGGAHAEQDSGVAAGLDRDFLARNPPSTPPPRVALTSNTGSPSKVNNSGPQGRHHGGRPTNGGAAGTAAFQPGLASPQRTGISKQTIRDSALRIIGTYLTPKATKEIELPSDNHGWSMAEEIRQLAHIPGGLENPKIFEGATTYVFEALEREALPGFLVNRALSNVQPVSATLRLVGGLFALFGAFWLSFVYVLLDWSPKSHRCWVILPFAFGWYLTITALYHVDPVLALSGFGERDGGGILKIQERFVRKILTKRSMFVLVSVTLLTAAFCVLFILVPGHRL